tara:strand:- start:177 stop:347 length:171 start_codon:yes stop_codon:yes gene_type:complete
MGAGVGDVYYAGDKRWTEKFADRKTYTSQAKTEAEDYIWEKNTTAGWNVTAINENA